MIIKVNKVVIESEKIDKDINIVFVSDFHVGMYIKKKELLKIINKINEVSGDYLVIGGDMVGVRPLKYYNDKELKDIFNSFNIKKRYFVGGNHDDYSLDLYKNFDILNDEIISVSDNVRLIGLKWEKGECLDYKLNRDNYNILLSHYPDRVCEYSKIDLALGAHSHGHQVNLPLCKFHHKEMYSRGLYDFKNNKHLYVNKGLGFSFLKIRFLSCREIVKIELRKCRDNGNN
jgi:predicted MPP superfamily phosphohydrolase